MKKFDITICVNPKAKQAQGSTGEQIKKLLISAGLSCNSLNPAHLKDTPEHALGSTLIAVGGDGTVNSVAAVAIKHNRKLGVVPQGTFNHFAKDVGLPMDIEAAVAVIVRGKTRSIDFGVVNDHVFLNNSVIGFYPLLVAKKEQLRPRYGKWPALVVSGYKVLTTAKNYHVVVAINGKELKLKTMMVLVANNKYDLTGIGLASRNRIDQGQLYVYVIKPQRLISMLRVSIRLLAGRAKSNDFDRYNASELSVELNKSSVRVALDGEVTNLATPLRYTSQSKALRVVC